ncbi:type IV pilus twitching motility protein PilT [Solidesulfovibrio sp.]|uniref:type IV pilus twitching motility protein PilT n=1 Tax=Solidesulfovibrio sp. TaxID=2910990 RepID=UPI002B1F1ED4|nr:ATPase, T2SS/T4P/T4SS family [Solidesulfovibrio sp.]MEA5087683.1 ATPase, T2SS/T4P/T4SS family [Solidesulfovibrio sp.]
MSRLVLDTLLGAALSAAPSASDYIFAAGVAPMALVDGGAIPLALPHCDGRLTPAQTETLARGVAGADARLVADLRARGGCDVSLAHPSGARFRVNVCRAADSLELVLRRLPDAPPALAALGLPPVFSRMTALAEGLVLVVGATGSGKSTTLAAVIDAILAARAVHVVTLEDPVECLFPPGRGIVSQRELGTDFPNFADGIRSALRQAPHVILVGEARDRETVDAALGAAETGHLVFATLHTADCAGAVERLLAFFAPGEQRLARQRLAASLRYVAAQRLLPRIGGGRAASVEVLAATLRVRDRILSGESDAAGFADIIEQGQPHGMVSFDAATAALYAAGVVSEETAVSRAADRAALSRALDAIKAGRGQPVSSITGLEFERPAAPEPGETP